MFSECELPKTPPAPNALCRRIANSGPLIVNSSTDASRFLAQSQSRLLSSHTDRADSPNDVHRGSGSRAPSRGYLQRQPLGNPYQPTNPQSSRFSFASRFSNQNPQAPLFHNATDEFREEDDGEEHEREVADFYALQRSRRDFGTSKLDESSGSEKDVGRPAPRAGWLLSGRGESVPRRGKGIRSSWTGDDLLPPNQQEQDTAKRKLPMDSTFSGLGVRGKDRLVDVELASTVHEDDEPRDESAQFLPDDGHQDRRSSGKANYQEPVPLPTFASRRAPSVDTESVLPMENIPQPDSPRHDAFWSTLFLICLASLFASFFLVCLHTGAPKKDGALGDTIYTTLRSSFHLLAVDTLVATVVALVWLAMLRSFVRPLILCIMVAVPIISFSFSLYPLISSYKGTWHGSSIQDRAMRWLSIIPAIFTIGWIYTSYKSRHSLGRAVELLEFATRVLAASPTLILVGFATLAGVVAWTWIWMLMFTRVFLGGHLSSSKTFFIIDTGTWWLGVFFILTYLWTLGIGAGIQRATTAATVSQWYFHRLATPTTPSQRVVRAAFDHAITTMFGTICLSTLLALAIRLPLLVLPRGLSRYLTISFYYFIPTSVATVTNPLTLTYAAIHSQPLTISAHGLSEMSFISATSPTTTLTPRAASETTSSGSAPPILAYRLAKLLLHATRFVTALAFGFGGWVSTARMLTLDNGISAKVTGSLYAYVVGLIAAAIGWAVLGAMEAVLGGVLDAIVVCWGSEVGRNGSGAIGGPSGAGYCREAGELLGGNEGTVGL